MRFDILNSKFWNGIVFYAVIVIVLVILTLIFSPVRADTKPEALTFTVDRYTVAGPSPLSPAATQSILSSHIGPALSLEDLRQAAADLEAAIREQGYAFYRVGIPAQALDEGSVQLQVRAFTISRVEVSDNQFHSRENVLNSLPGLREGISPRTSTLKRALAISNLNPSKHTQVFFAVEPEEGLEAKISLRDQKTHNGLIWVNDTGSEDTGMNRIGLAYQNSNLFDRDHSLTASFSTSPEQVEDVQQYSLSYQVPFYSIGGLMNVHAIRSDVDTGTIATFFDVAGRGDFMGADFTYALPNVGVYKHFLVGGLDDKLFENDIDFQGQPIGIDVRSRPLFVRHRGDWKQGVLSGSTYVGYYQNIESGEYNNDIRYEATRAGARPDWSALRFGGRLEYALKLWSIVARLNAQYSDDELIPGEQFGVGGLDSLRGINQRQLTGDRGLFLSGEIVSPPISERGPKLVAFTDGASVSKMSTLPGEVASDTVFSVGSGLRWNWKQHFNISLDYGYVVDGGSAGSIADINEGDSRFHFQIMWRI